MSKREYDLSQDDSQSKKIKKDKDIIELDKSFIELEESSAEEFPETEGFVMILILFT